MTHLYTFHDPAPLQPVRIERAASIVGIKDGMAWWALPVPLIWLMWHGLWRALVVYVLAMFAVGVLVEFLPLSPWAGGLIGALFNVAVAVQGNDLRRVALARRGYLEVAALRADNFPEAECLFFDRWTSGRLADVSAPAVSVHVSGLKLEPA